MMSNTITIHVPEGPIVGSQKHLEQGRSRLTFELTEEQRGALTLMLLPKGHPGAPAGAPERLTDAEWDVFCNASDQAKRYIPNLTPEQVARIPLPTWMSTYAQCPDCQQVCYGYFKEFQPGPLDGHYCSRCTDCNAYALECACSRCSRCWSPEEPHECPEELTGFHPGCFVMPEAK